MRCSPPAPSRAAAAAAEPPRAGDLRALKRSTPSCGTSSGSSPAAPCATAGGWLAAAGFRGESACGLVAAAYVATVEGGVGESGGAGVQCEGGCGPGRVAWRSADGAAGC